MLIKKQCDPTITLGLPVLDLSLSILLSCQFPISLALLPLVSPGGEPSQKEILLLQLRWTD